MWSSSSQFLFLQLRLKSAFDNAQWTRLSMSARHCSFHSAQRAGCRHSCAPSCRVYSVRRSFASSWILATVCRAQCAPPRYHSIVVPTAKVYYGMAVCLCYVGYSGDGKPFELQCSHSGSTCLRNAFTNAQVVLVIPLEKVNAVYLCPWSVQTSLRWIWLAATSPRR